MCNGLAAGHHRTATERTLKIPSFEFQIAKRLQITMAAERLDKVDGPLPDVNVSACQRQTPGYGRRQPS